MVLFVRRSDAVGPFSPANYPTVHRSGSKAPITVSVSLHKQGRGTSLILQFLQGDIADDKYFRKVNDSDATQFGIMFPSIPAHGELELSPSSGNPRLGHLPNSILIQCGPSSGYYSRLVS